MKIIFMGTPEFAVPSLRIIAGSRHEIKAVVTKPDMHCGRGCRLQEPPVKKVARQLNLPILQPDSLKSPDFLAEIAQFSAGLYVVVAFRILPPELLVIPPRGAINLHASLLPRYRGAAPINWALINGEKETGVTVFQIKPTVDTGNILLQERVAIQPTDTYGTLAPRLAEIGARLILAAIDGLEAGTLKGTPQDDGLATPAPKIFPELGEIDWYKPASDLKNLIHGLSPTPGAFTFFRGKRLKILRASVIDEKFPGEPGTIVLCNKNSLSVLTGSGVLKLEELQFEGRKSLPAAEFLCGFGGRVGDKFAS